MNTSLFKLLWAQDRLPFGSKLGIILGFGEHGLLDMSHRLLEEMQKISLDVTRLQEKIQSSKSVLDATR